MEWAKDSLGKLEATREVRLCSEPPEFDAYEAEKLLDEYHPDHLGMQRNVRVGPNADNGKFPPEPNPTGEKLRVAYPKLDRCTKCGSCTTACPMSIPVMDSVLRMRSGELDKVAENFTTCIHCGLCRFVCEDGVQPHMMGMWVRRSIGISMEQDNDKILEKESQQAELEWEYLLDGNSTDKMNHARQFRKSGKIES